MSTYAEEHAAWFRKHHADPGRRWAIVGPSAARILTMLAPRPWEPGHELFATESLPRGQVRVSWEPAYDQRILAQADSPGFPRGARKAIMDGFEAGGALQPIRLGAHRTRLLGRSASRAVRRSGGR